MNKPNLSIIIVSWNVKDLLQKCLSSIEARQADLVLEIIVVDNASQDGTVAMVKDSFPQVRLIANNKNFGFAAANNQAIKQARGEFILLLNPDTEIIDESLSKALDYIKHNLACGICGVKLLNPDRSLQLSVRRFPSWWPIFLMLLKLPKIFKNLKAVNHYLATDFDYTKTQAVDQVMGAFMLIRGEVLDRIGLLDERFFIWFEEVDLCWRVKQAGYQVCYFSEAQIIHYGGQSFSRAAVVTKQKLFFTSAWRYFIKHGFSYPK